MTCTIEHRGKMIKVGEDTPLTLKGLAQFFHQSRQTIYDDVKRGYLFEFGSTTTPAHYREWLTRHPRPTRRSKAREAALKLEGELSRLN